MQEVLSATPLLEREGNSMLLIERLSIPPELYATYRENRYHTILSMVSLQTPWPLLIKTRKQSFSNSYTLYLKRLDSSSTTSLGETTITQLVFVFSTYDPPVTGLL